MRPQSSSRSNRSATRTLLLSAAILTATANFGCAHFSTTLDAFSPPASSADSQSITPLEKFGATLGGIDWLGRDATSDASVEPLDSEISRDTEICRWLVLSQAGRSAMAEGDLRRAQEIYRAAVACTTDLPTQDARFQTSLEHLVAVAAAHRRLGDDGTAELTMQRIHETASARGLHETAVERLDLRFEELSTTKRQYTRHVLPIRRLYAPNRRGFDRMILSAAETFDVDPALVKAVVAAESNFDPMAVSPVGAQGLMQLMPNTAREMGVDWPFDPKQNLKGGVRYLRAMLDRFGDTRFALAAYNAGPEAVHRHGGIPPYRETQNYVKRVMKFYANYQMQTISSAFTDSES